MLEVRRNVQGLEVRRKEQKLEVRRNVQGLEVRRKEQRLEVGVKTGKARSQWKCRRAIVVRSKFHRYEGLRERSANCKS